MTDRDIKPENLAALAAACLAAADPWPRNWSVEMDVDDDIDAAYFRCWAADDKDGATQEMALGSEDYDDKLATYIALLANSTPQLARGYLEAVEELEEREHAMHMRIRAGYDTTVADSWRAENAKLTADLAAANRELERWRHGHTIEGDFVCPDSLALREARAEIERLRNDAVVVRDGHWDEVLAELATAREELAALKSRLLNGPTEPNDLAERIRAALTAERDAARESLREACDIIEGFRPRPRHSGESSELANALRKKGGLL